MTVANKSPSKSYTEDGATLTFAVPFRYADPAHLVVKRTVGGVTSTLGYGVHYSASPGDTDAGGTVTLFATINGAQLRIRRATPRSQQTDYVTYDNFPAETHERVADVDMMIEQEQDVAASDAQARNLRVPDGETVNQLPGATARAGMVLGFDLSGQPVASSPSVPASAAQPERLVLTLEQFGGAPGWQNAGNRGVDNHAALMRCLDAINRYAPVNARWPRVPRIELGLGAYFFSQEIDLKVACHLHGQGTGVPDFNGGTRFIVPAGSRGITVNDSNTRAGGTEDYTTSAMGTTLEGISFEAEAKAGTYFDWSNPGTNTCGIWLRTMATVRDCQAKRFRGNALQVVASVAGGGALQGNASGFVVDGLTAHECDGQTSYVWGADANGGLVRNVQAQAGGMGGLADIDTFGNTYQACVLQGTAFRTQGLVTMAACWYGGIRYNLVDPTPGIGAATTPGTNSAIWYPYEPAGAPSDFYPAWSAAGTYICMSPVLCIGDSNHSVFEGIYIEGGQPGEITRSQAVAIGGLGGWTRTSRRLYGNSVGTRALYGNTGFAQRVYCAPGSSEKTNFGDYYEAGAGGSYEPGTFWYGRCHKDNETDWMKGFASSGEIWERRGTLGIVERISTEISNRKFGRSANVPYVKTFPNFAMADPDDYDNDRIMRGGIAAPTTGEHAAGERVWNAAPGPGKPDYWECVTGGTPGTWIGVNVASFQNGAAAAALTGSTSETVLATLNLPAKALGANGVIEADITWSMVNNANSKTLRARLGGLGGFAFWSQAVTTSISARGQGRCANRNSQSAQVGFSGATSGANTTALPTGTIDTSLAQTIVITGQLANAADSLTLESYTVRILPGA